MRWLALVLCLSSAALADIAAEAPAPEAALAPPPAPAAVHPEGIEKVPMGVIQGGWGYVYAAYGAGLLGLAVYAASLFLRRTEAPPPGAP